MQKHAVIEETVPFPKELNYPREIRPGVKAALSVFDCPTSVEVELTEHNDKDRGLTRKFTASFVYPGPREEIGGSPLYVDPPVTWVFGGAKTGRILEVVVDTAGGLLWSKALTAVRYLLRDYAKWAVSR